MLNFSARHFQANFLKRHFSLANSIQAHTLLSKVLGFASAEHKKTSTKLFIQHMRYI